MLLEGSLEAASKICGPGAVRDSMGGGPVLIQLVFRFSRECGPLHLEVLTSVVRNLLSRICHGYHIQYDDENGTFKLQVHYSVPVVSLLLRMSTLTVQK